MLCCLHSSARSHRVILGEYDRQSGAEPIQVKTISKVSVRITQNALFRVVFRKWYHIVHESLCSHLIPGHQSPILQLPELQQWHHPAEAVVASTVHCPCVSCVPGLLLQQHPLWNQMCHHRMGKDWFNLWVTSYWSFNSQIWDELRWVQALQLKKKKKEGKGCECRTTVYILQKM